MAVPAWHAMMTAEELLALSGDDSNRISSKENRFAFNLDDELREFHTR